MVTHIKFFIMENTYKPYSTDQNKSFNIAYLMKKWIEKSNKYDKGGSFNLDLYLRYLEVINEQPIK